MGGAGAIRWGSAARSCKVALLQSALIQKVCDGVLAQLVLKTHDCFKMHWRVSIRPFADRAFRLTKLARDAPLSTILSIEEHVNGFL